MKIKNFSPFLIVSEGGNFKVTKTRPALAIDEIAIRLDIEVPQSAFERPHLVATLRVSEKDVAPPTLDEETIESTRAAIEAGTGFSVKIALAEPEGA